MSAMPVPPSQNRDARIFRSTVIVIATVAAAYILWRLVDVLLLLFACILVALILLTLTRRLRRWLPLPFGAALALTVVLLFALIGGVTWFFGSTMRTEFAILIERLPAAWAEFQVRLQQSPIGASVIDRARELIPNGRTIVDAATKAVAAVGGIVSAMLIILVGGLYLAAQPALYGGGLLKLVPTRQQARTTETLDVIATSLKGWLKGQALGMLFVGVATGLVLGIIGVPAALALGLLAGFAEFVPYLGVLIAGLPAVILAFAQGTNTGLWTLGVLLAVHQIQGNIVMPLLQNRMVELPPALTVFGIIAAGILLGPAGVLLATPLTVILLVLVRRLYLNEGAETVLASSEASAPATPAPSLRSRSS